MKLNQLLKIHAIWNSHVYHGWGRSRKFFEGWYYKVVDNSQTNAFAIIPGIAMDENGNKQSQGNYKDGKLDGLYIEWYENGQKRLEGTNIDGTPDGLGTLLYENGQKNWEGTYKDGKLISSKEWNEDGSVVE